MVDFQERDTRRGLRELREDDSDGPEVDGEAEIDEVRQQLEERPDASDEDSEDDGTGEDADTKDGDEHEPADLDERPPTEHHDHDLESVGAAVVTISSSRTLADDPSGDYVIETLVEEGHDVVTRELIPDDYDDIQHIVDTLVRRDDVDLVVTTGGTGVTPDDRTIEAVRPLFEKELPGFGELFRRYSSTEVGTRVVGTRSTAGIIDGSLVICLPGSADAVRLGIDKIVVKEAPHLAGRIQRDRTDEE